MIRTDELLAIGAGGIVLLAMLTLIVVAVWQASGTDFGNEPLLKRLWIVLIVAVPIVGAGAWLTLRTTSSPWTGAPPAPW